MKPINDHDLQKRLGSSSKSRLSRFRRSLKKDWDRRNFDMDILLLLKRYAKPERRKMLKRIVEYLGTLESSSDGRLYSQGVKSYAQMKQAMERFLEPNYTSFRWNKNYKAAKQYWVDHFRKLRLTMLKYHDDESMVKALPKETTHSGFQYVLSGLRKKIDNMGNIYKVYSKEENSAKEAGSFNKPILPWFRTQGAGAYDDEGNETGDCEHKTRLISMVDLFVIFAELKFAKPVQEAMARERWYAGGFDQTAIKTVIGNMREKLCYWATLDYSKYDQSISDWLIEDAFDIVKAAFVDVDEQLFSVIVEDFIHKNFVFGDEVLYAEKGVPSGSMFTQIIDSIVNVLMITTFLFSEGIKGEMIVMGDDNLLFTDRKVELKEIASYIKKNFGIKVNTDKEACGGRREDPQFLSLQWRDSGWWREPHTVVAKMLYPERKRDYRAEKAKVEEVLYGFILTYPSTMEWLIDTERFKRDHPKLSRKYIFQKVDSRYMPGALAFIRDYTMCA